MNAPSEYRRFRDMPNLVFVNQVRDLIQQTGRPEDIASLYRRPIAKTEPFQRLAEFNIEPEKRPDGDRAPCPMCTPNRYLGGRLIYLKRLEAVAAVGHCCADQETAAAADREFAQRSSRDYQEGFLLQNLPRVPGLLRMAAEAMPIAKEATTVYNRFQGVGGAIHKHLRQLRKVGGVLTHHEELGEEAIGAGPRAFGRTGAVREVQFGAICGLTALLAAYNPDRELQNIQKAFMTLDRGESEDAALEYIITLSEKDRADAVKLLQKTEQALVQCRERLSDFASFFSDANIDTLAAWAEHPLNREQFYVARQVEGQYRIIQMNGWGVRLRLSINPVLWKSISLS